ncbi:methyltransferase domain-containing protein [Candidatus Uhrbacteria bacterium]|nr:methyltransferase domain-containing protein [Candidatus Uhrbacteria bacterium]
MSPLIFSLTSIALGILCCLLGVIGYLMINGILTVPWVRTSGSISRKMLTCGGFKAGDRVLDLGCGDGAIIHEAVKMGGTGVGLERLRLLVLYARFLATTKGTSDRAQFSVSDILKDPLPETDIITCYLFPEVNKRLEPRLQELFPSGTRVVSRDFTFPNLRLLSIEDYQSTKIYLYEI